ncbi:MAG: hypothetical protein HS116_21815 [Planctomycetes bacterium]|nr:hypothetical protein [Planctomycetota bacterium]
MLDSVLGLLAALLSTTLWAEEGGLAERLDAGIARTLAALIAKQSADGGFHSETYGVLKPGAATTAFVLETLSRLPEAQRAVHAQALERAMAFVKATEAEGRGIGSKGEWLEYPVYSTALAIRTWLRLKPAGWEADAARWRAFLVAQQHAEANGCAPEHPAYGGWSAPGLTPGRVNRDADLSATRYALDALLASDLDAKDPLWRRARVFLGRHGNATDGGYVYSRVLYSKNKAGDDGRSETGYRSYGSATLDGLLILECLGMRGQPDDMGALIAAEPLKKARAWWAATHALAGPAGFEGATGEQAAWAQAMNFYYRAALAEAAASGALDLKPEAWRELAELTLRLQSADGLWRNESALMKEDDPLLASPMALQVLLHARGRNDL